MDRGAWWATVHGVAKSWTQLSTYTHVYSQLVLVIGGIVLTLRTFNKIWELKKKNILSVHELFKQIAMRACGSSILQPDEFLQGIALKEACDEISPIIIRQLLLLSPVILRDTNFFVKIFRNINIS